MINDTTRYNSYISTGYLINDKQSKINNMIFDLKLKQLAIDKKYNRIHTSSTVENMKELERKLYD